MFSFLAIAFVPMAASAQPADRCTLRHDITDIDPACTAGSTVDESVTSLWGMCCLLDAVYTLTDWVFTILMLLVALLVIWGAFIIVTAGGAPEKVTSGRNYILYAMIGMVVALFARAIPSIVKALVGI